MDISRAVALVIADASEGWEPTSDEDVIAHVLNVLRLPESTPVLGSHPMVDDGSDVAIAYRIVLEAGARESAASIVARAAH